MKNRQQSGKLRIIGGKWRGRKLEIADIDGLRPTTDRVRETLFNWIQPTVYAARCLDLFAGSGALGIEAASRGAAEVDLVEKDRRVVQILSSQVKQLNAEGIKVHQADALQWLGTAPHDYDIIFLDPPFNDDVIPHCCELILEHGLLSSRGRLYIETAEADFARRLPTGLTLLKSKRAGQVYYALATLTEQVK